MRLLSILKLCIIFLHFRCYSFSFLAFYKARLAGDSIVVSFRCRIDEGDTNLSKQFQFDPVEFDVSLLGRINLYNSFFIITDKHGNGQFEKSNPMAPINYISTVAQKTKYFYSRSSYCLLDSISSNILTGKIVIFLRRKIKLGLFRKNRYVILYLKTKDRNFNFDGIKVPYFISKKVRIL